MILEIFHRDARYHERVFQEAFYGHQGIKDYWEQKVVKEQKNIRFKLLNLFIENNTAIAEWDAKFYDVLQAKNKHIREVAILEFDNNKISYLREYWATKN